MEKQAKKLIVKVTENQHLFQLHQVLGVSNGYSYISIHQAPSRKNIKQLLEEGVFYAITSNSLNEEIVAYKGDIISIYREKEDKEIYQEICSKIWAYYDRRDYPAILYVKNLTALNKQQLIDEVEGVSYTNHSKYFNINEFSHTRRANYLYLT